MQESSTRTLAKTTRPFLAASVVPRPRLFAHLDGALAGSAVWIQGMPGAGKTSLLASYVESHAIDTLWYQLDAGDGSLASFIGHLCHAAARRFGQAPSLSTGGTDEASLRRLFRELYRGFDGPFLFVVDNCNDAPATSRVHHALAIAVEESPPAGTVVFLARHAPSAALARLRASGALTMIGPDELALDAGEVRAIIRARDVALDEEALHAVVEATGGWAAGLVLMLEHARAGGEVTRTPAGLSPQVIFDYLAFEVFEQFEPATRHTLCAVSFMRRVTGALAVAVSGEPVAVDVLQNMARNSYFVSRTDDDRTTWFEFHPLFQRFLAKEAAQRFDGRECADQRDAAASWLDDNGYPDEALRLRARARDWDGLERAFARHGASLLAMADIRDLQPALATLAEDEARGRPWLLHWRAHIELEGDPRAARRLHALAYDAFEGGATGGALCAWGVLRAILTEFDDLSLADPWIGRLSASLEGEDVLPTNVLAAARRTLEVAMVLRGRIPVHDDGDDRAANPLLRACVDCLRGEFATAAAHLPTPGEAPVDAATELVAAGFHFLRGEVDACRASLQRCAEAPATGLQQLLVSALEVACEPIAEADTADPIQLANAGPARLRTALEGYLDGWRLALSGDPLDAYHRTREGAGAAAQLGLRVLETVCQAALAERAAACADLDGAAQALVRCVDTPVANLPVLAFPVQLAAAEVALHGEDPVMIKQALAHALGIGRARGLRVVLGYRPQAIARLCAQALEADIEPEYARSLLRAHGLAGHAPDGAPARWPWPVRIHALGGLRVERHGQLLRLSGKGESRLVELVKALLAHGGRDVPQDRLAALLWPHVDGDYAYRSFTQTVYRLRKLLDVPDAVVVQDGNISLNPACCWVDLWGLDRLLTEVEQALWDAPGSGAADRVAELARALEQLHLGAFLGDTDEHAACVSLRARLRRRLLRALVRLATYWEARGECERAVDVLQHAVDADPSSEGLYRELMLLLERLGRAPEALEVFRICCTALDASGQQQPDAATRAIAERLQKT